MMATPPPPPPVKSYWTITTLFLTFFSSSSIIVAHAASPPQPSACQRITIPMCVGIGYNHTHMPNAFNHETQDEAGLEVHQYWPLVVINCSADLRFFLCSVYTPICMTDYKGSVPPCRSVCLRAKHGCEPVMTQYGFLWPERMSCDRFPPYGVKNQVCMDERRGEGVQQQQHSTTVVNVKPHPPPTTNKKKPSSSSSQPSSHKKNSSSSFCPPPLVRARSSNATTVSPSTAGAAASCLVGCHFGTSAEERRFARGWIATWAGLCLAISLITIGTFCANRGERFKYPERPVVYMSGCYGFVSAGYLLRVYVGHEAVACNGNGNVIKYGVSSFFHNGNVNGNTDSDSDTLCLVVFGLIYYFGMAAAVWWVTLSLTWYLAAGCKWGSEAIAAHAGKYHLLAWTAPTVGTALALANNVVDGDPVAGICLVGNQSASSLLQYVVVPLGALLLVGTSFLLAGFIALVRIRRVLSEQAGGRSKTEKLEKLMLRIGVFGVLYALPAASVIAAYLYEIHAKQLFLNAINNNCNDNGNCSSSTTGSTTTSSSHHLLQLQQLRPSYPVLMIKYFMSLAVGTTSGLVWIWSGKTLETWRDLILCSSSHSKHDNKKQQAAAAAAATATTTAIGGGKLISHV